MIRFVFAILLMVHRILRDAQWSSSSSSTASVIIRVVGMIDSSLCSDLPLQFFSFFV